MARLSPYIFSQEFDNNGNPLSGGLIYTYEAGTSTPKVTYADSAGTIPNSNPIVLDASGRYVCWLDSGAYKFTLRTSAGVLIETKDDIAGDTANAFGSSVVSISGNLSITTAYRNNVIIATAAATLSLLPAASAEDGFYFVIKNDSASANVTIDPNLAELIDGASTFILRPMQSAICICNGTSWSTLFVDNMNDSIQATSSAGIIIKNNTATPVLTLGAGGGTGATFAGGVNITGTTALSAALNTARGSDIASGATTNIGTATGNFVHITGTTTITSLGTVGSSAFRIVRFADSLTLTHNATSLILPTGANIVTQANDMAIFVNDNGASNWRCVSYERASGASLSSNSSLSSTVALTSGTTQDINIPANTRQFTLNLSGMSFNASAQPNMLLGTSGSFETTGYVSTATFASTAVGSASSSASVIFATTTATASDAFSGSIIFTLVDLSTNEWAYSGVISASTIPSSFLISGSKALSSALTRIRLTSVAGTATFDAGKANVFSVL